MPFPGNLLAVAAGIAAVATAVMSAKQLSATVKQAKLANGGELYGPSHDSGGIKGTGRFANIEVEGGEFVTNKHAYRNNREAIEKINSAGRSMRFVAIPAHQLRKFADGGALPENGGASAAKAAQGEGAVVSEATLSRIEALLGNIESHTARAAAKDIQIGPYEAKAISDMAKGVESDEAGAKLF